MAEHLTMVGLRRALSAQGRVSEKVADDFLSALTASIQDGLKADGSVTVNGLGTFKLQEMPARESVDVSTGERITIEGYKKVVFTQGTLRAKAAKHAQEEPIDPIKKLGEQAEEIKDILSEIGSMSFEGSLAESGEHSLADSSHQATPPLPPINGAETGRQAGLSDNNEESAAVEEPQPQPVVEQPAEQPAEEPKEEKDEKKPFNPWLTGLITIGVFAMVLVIVFFILRHSIIQWAENMRSNLEQRANTPKQQTVEPEKTADFAAEAEAVASVESTEQTDVTAASTEAKEPSYYNDAERKFTEWQATEIVGQDSRLAWVAKKHYGEKALWVFIYEANRDKLNAPDYVLPGMELRIPKLPAELRDVNNPQTKALLERLSKEYLGFTN